MLLSPIVKRYGLSIWTNLNPLHPGNAFCQVWLNLAHWLYRRKSLNFVNVFSPFRNYLPLEKGVALDLNKVHSPSPKDDFCQVWLKLAPWFWRKRFFKFVNVFSPFQNYLPLERIGAPFIWRNLNTGLQITLKLQGPCGPLTDQVLLAHINILGPTFSIKC